MSEKEFYENLDEVTKPLKKSIRPTTEVLRTGTKMPRRGSQSWRILKKFTENLGILYTGDFMKMYIARYGARIGDLRNRYGWNIQTERVKQGRMKYTLEFSEYNKLFTNRFEIFGDQLNLHNDN
jgi:hypothetical protein